MFIRYTREGGYPLNKRGLRIKWGMTFKGLSC